VKTKRLLYVALIAVALLGLTALLSARQPVQYASADAVTNYQGFITVDAGTAHSADWNATPFSVESYGSVVIQVGQVLSDSRNAVTYTLYGSIQPVACGSVTQWFPLVDWIFYDVQPTIDSVATTNYTQTGQITDTYVASSTMAFTYDAVQTWRGTIAQRWTQDGDVTEGYTWNVGGVRCVKISADIAAGDVATTTIYVAPVDIYD